MAAQRRDRSARIVDAALKLIAEQGWSVVDLDSVAEASGVERDEVYRLTPTRAAMLELFARRIDLDVADIGASPPPDGASDDGASDGGASDGAGGDGEDGESAPAADDARDRVFDVLMRRFDALDSYREAIVVLSRELPRDPASLAALAPQAHRSFAMMLREAGIADRGIVGRLRVAALIGVWMATLRIWLADDSADKERTMAALDRHLRRLFDWSPVFRTLD